MNTIEKQALTQRPKWNRKWETNGNGFIVILIPKFGSHILGKWLASQMATPNYRLNLDQVGSFVWQNCDGMKNFEEIANGMSKKFGSKVDPVYERLSLFFQSLEKSKSITWV